MKQKAPILLKLTTRLRAVFVPGTAIRYHAVQISQLKEPTNDPLH
jgi:hypothetical protein